MKRLAILATVLFAASPALAHVDGETGNGFVSGFMHPVGGLDHVIAMVAVGIWGAFLGKPQIWVLPVVFPLVMAFGAILGIAGLPVPFIEPGIALSGIVLGLMILFAVRAPIAVSAPIVGLFAIFHGYAHGAELPASAGPVGYAFGFVMATGLMHLAGIAFGALRARKAGDMALKIVGGLIAMFGGAFLLGWA